MLPDQPFYFSVCELPLEAVASAHSPDSDSGIVKLSTTTVSRPRSRMVLVHFELKSDASALSGHTTSLSVNGKAYHDLPFTMVNITALLSRKVNNELVIWGQLIPMHVTVHVDVLKKVTEEELLQTINYRAVYVHTHVDFANLALSVAEGKGYAELHVLKVSYLCPLTRSRMRVPGRGVRCRHLEGFDVFAYLGLNESSLEASRCCPVYSSKSLSRTYAWTSPCWKSSAVNRTGLCFSDRMALHMFLPMTTQRTPRPPREVLPPPSSTVAESNARSANTSSTLNISR